eukprot:1302201-Lingulodinium_polyedra.AAC.1
MGKQLSVPFIEQAAQACAGIAQQRRIVVGKDLAEHVRHGMVQGTTTAAAAAKTTMTMTTATTTTMTTTAMTRTTTMMTTARAVRNASREPP